MLMTLLKVIDKKQVGKKRDIKKDKRKLTF